MYITTAPSTTPPPVKRRNEPCLLPWIGRRLAALRGETPEALAALTFANSAVFLGD